MRYLLTSASMLLPTRCTGYACQQSSCRMRVLTVKQGLAEGHACEQSARRNAMDVSLMIRAIGVSCLTHVAERIQERRRHDQQVPDSLQPNPSSRHYWRTCRDYHWCCCFSRVEALPDKGQIPKARLSNPGWVACRISICVHRLFITQLALICQTWCTRVPLALVLCLSFHTVSQSLTMTSAAGARL